MGEGSDLPFMTRSGLAFWPASVLVRNADKLLKPFAIFLPAMTSLTS